MWSRVSREIFMLDLVRPWRKHFSAVILMLLWGYNAYAITGKDISEASRVFSAVLATLGAAMLYILGWANAVAVYTKRTCEDMRAYRANCDEIVAIERARLEDTKPNPSINTGS